MQPYILKGSSVIVLNAGGQFNKDVFLCLPPYKTILSLIFIGVTFSLL